VRQGHYAIENLSMYRPADLSIERIGELNSRDPSSLGREPNTAPQEAT